MFPEIFKKSADLTQIEKDVEAPSPRRIHEKRKALSNSIKEGALSNVSLNLGGAYITPFALALSSSAFQIGILTSLSSLVRPLSQVYGSRLIERKSRKSVVTAFVLLQSLMWFPVLALSYLFINNLFSSYLPYVLIAFYTILVALGGITYPAWFSWMGDLIPEKDRGRYFGIKTKITGLVGLSVAIIGAFLLDFFKTQGLALLGFSILFALAATFRFIAFLLLKKQYCPKFKQKRDKHTSLLL